jgi:hypothetical protein
MNNVRHNGPQNLNTDRMLSFLDMLDPDKDKGFANCTGVLLPSSLFLGLELTQGCRGKIRTRHLTCRWQARLQLIYVSKIWQGEMHPFLKLQGPRDSNRQETK